MGNISIIICTCDRAESLRATLESIAIAEVPSTWNVELLVIDNGTKKNTREVVRQFRFNNITLRYIAEPQPGLCYARNTGLANTSGEVILFTDDDVRVPKNWITAMCQPLLDGRLDAIAGGVIFPAEIAEILAKPHLSELGSWFASSEELDPNNPDRMIGANMGFLRQVLSKVPSFDIEVGPGPMALGFGDETLFSKQLIAAGFKLGAELGVAVHHHFDLQRVQRYDLIRTARKFGRSHAFIFYHWEYQKSRLPILRSFLSRITLHQARRAYKLEGDSNIAVFRKLLDAEKNHAFDDEYLLQSRRPHKYALRGLVPLPAASK